MLSLLKKALLGLILFVNTWNNKHRESNIPLCDTSMPVDKNYMWV